MNLSIKAKFVIISIILTLIPVLTLGIVFLVSFNSLEDTALTNLNNMGKENLNESIKALDNKSSENLQLRAVETGLKIADFLYERDRDILGVSLMEPAPQSYLQFYQLHYGKVVKHSDYKVGQKRQLNWNKNNIKYTNPLNQKDYQYYDSIPFQYDNIPLFSEMTFYDLNGMEKIKIQNGRISNDLKDISKKENTYCKAETYKELVLTKEQADSDFYHELKDKNIKKLLEELKIAKGRKWQRNIYSYAKDENGKNIEITYFEKAKKLKKGEIYVSRMVGEYVPTHLIGSYTKEKADKAKKQYEPEKSAYAGKENPDGKEFKGIIRWVTPVYKNGVRIGYVTLALDHKHIMEFTDHIMPTDERFTDITDPGSGNYAFLWDDAHRCISHGRDYFIMGYDPNSGEEVPALQTATWGQQFKSGKIGLDCKVLKEKAIQCEGWINQTEQGGSGAFHIFWSGLWKFTTVASVPYYTGDYNKSKRGFGYITIGAEVSDFHKDANIMKNKINGNIASTKDNLKDVLINMTGVIIALCIVLAIGMVFLSLYFSKKMTTPLKEMTRCAKEVSAGNFNISISYKANDEVGFLGETIIQMTKNLETSFHKIEEQNKQFKDIDHTRDQFIMNTTESVNHISDTTDQLNNLTGILDNEINNSLSAVNSISTSISSMTNSIGEQSAALHQSSASIEEMTASINQIAVVSEDKRKLSADVSNMAKEGLKKMEEAISSINKIAESTASMLEMVEVIDAITEQTNLLAMNAAIEAAHAGDAGKGFAVVADEIRKLAEQTSISAKSINTTLKGVVQDIHSASEINKMTGEAFKNIVAGIEDVVGAMIEMKNNTSELSTGGQETLKSLTSLTSITEEIKDLSGDINSKTSSINDGMTTISDSSSQTVSAMKEISNKIKEISSDMNKLSQIGFNTSDNAEKSIAMYR